MEGGRALAAGNRKGCLIAGEGGPCGCCVAAGLPGAWGTRGSVDAGETELSPRVESGRHPGLNSKVLGSELEITPLPPRSCPYLGALLHLSVAHLSKSAAVPPPRVS